MNNDLMIWESDLFWLAQDQMCSYKLWCTSSTRLWWHWWWTCAPCPSSFFAYYDSVMAMIIVPHHDHPHIHQLLWLSLWLRTPSHLLVPGTSTPAAQQHFFVFKFFRWLIALLTLALVTLLLDDIFSRWSAMLHVVSVVYSSSSCQSCCWRCSWEGERCADDCSEEVILVARGKSKDDTLSSKYYWCLSYRSICCDDSPLLHHPLVLVLVLFLSTSS